MIEEIGRVVSIAASGVVVETVRQSACDSCSASKGCGQKMIASVGQGQRFEVVANNPRQLILTVGDEVVLGLAEEAFLKASFLAYLFPLLFMIVAAVLADLMALSDIFIALSGFSGLAVGLVTLKFFVQSDHEHCQYHPEILRAQGPIQKSILEVH